VPLSRCKPHQDSTHNRESMSFVIPTEASRRFFFRVRSCERVGLRSGGTLA
jgi:hypothetical protein